MADPQHEPTMEEILASIRKIISEDAPEGGAPAAEAAPAAAPFQDDVLELTQKVEEAETIGDLDVFEAPPEPEPVAVAPPEPAPEPVAFAAAFEAEDALVSEPISAAVTSAFGQLQQRIGMPSPSTTLDGVVRELLRPLLKEWLDANLRGIVEAKVEEEVERQARRFRS